MHKWNLAALFHCCEASLIYWFGRVINRFFTAILNLPHLLLLLLRWLLRWTLIWNLSFLYLNTCIIWIRYAILVFSWLWGWLFLFGHVLYALYLLFTQYICHNRNNIIRPFTLIYNMSYLRVNLYYILVVGGSWKIFAYFSSSFGFSISWWYFSRWTSPRSQIWSKSLFGVFVYLLLVINFVWICYFEFGSCYYILLPFSFSLILIA